VIIGPLLDELCHNVIYLSINAPVVIVNKEPEPEYDEFQANDATEFSDTVAAMYKITSEVNDIGLIE
jgi:hypothetical protein